MFIVSPKWIYLNNKRLEKDKSLVIDESIIVDILDTKSVEKNYSKLDKIEYSNHILIPTFTESFINMDDCFSQSDIDRKLEILLKNGVTRIQVVSEDYKNLVSYNTDNNLDMSYIVSFNGKTCNQNNIKDIINMLDFYKSDPTKKFSFNLINILNFENSLIEKLASISNEININIHIQGDVLSEIKDKNEIDNIIKFWDSINLLNNCYLHNIFYKNETWLSFLNKKSIKLMIDYNDINSQDKLNSFLSIIERNYTCILITDKSNFFNLYKIMSIIKTLNVEDFDTYCRKIINCVTTNTSNIFSKSNNSGCIKKGLVASFNIYDYSINSFTIKDNSHQLCNLDNQSLTHVWSAGKKVIF